jgi:hypothetical protein
MVKIGVKGQRPQTFGDGLSTSIKKRLSFLTFKYHI